MSNIYSCPVRVVDKFALRDLFNRHQFYAQVQSGVLIAKVKKDRHPSLPLAKEPFCTRSQLVYYYNQDGDQVAIVHQYLRTDGTLGLSGKPDPKKLRVDDVIYILVE